MNKTQNGKLKFVLLFVDVWQYFDKPDEWEYFLWEVMAAGTKPAHTSHSTQGSEESSGAGRTETTALFFLLHTFLKYFGINELHYINPNWNIYVSNPI